MVERLLTRQGTIVSSNNYGMFVVVDPATNHEYVFTLDKVETYDGRDPRKMGLVPGKQVRFSEEFGKVTSVRASD